MPEGNEARRSRLHSIERFVIGSLMAAAIAVMLTGVFLRYVMVPITDALDMDAISFFWVEETGEMLLCYLAMVGAAVAIAERAHFTVAVIVHTLPAAAQRAVHVFNLAVTALVGGTLAWQGWRLAQLNIGLPSPSLGISVAWGYGAAVAGGVLIAVYALRAMTDPPAVETVVVKAE